jgi:hypothetical protein
VIDSEELELRLFELHQMKKQKMKEFIALTCSKIVENPQLNLTDRIKALNKFIEDKDILAIITIILHANCDYMRS